MLVLVRYKGMIGAIHGYCPDLNGRTKAMIIVNGKVEEQYISELELINLPKGLQRAEKKEEKAEVKKKKLINKLMAKAVDKKDEILTPRQLMSKHTQEDVNRMHKHGA